MLDHARVDITDVRIDDCEVYEAAFYLKNECFINMERVHFNRNMAHDKALVSMRWNSFFSLADASFMGNRAVNSTALIYVDGPPFMRYYDDTKVKTNGLKDKDGFFRDVFTLKRPPYYEMRVSPFRRSYLDMVLIQNNSMRYGGSLITVVNSNLFLKRVRVLGNEMFFKHGGVHGVHSTIELEDCTFDMSVTKTFLEQPHNAVVSQNVVGGFVYVGAGSFLKSRRNKYQNARANSGGCIGIEDHSLAESVDDTFTKCVAS